MELSGKRVLDYCCGTGKYSIKPALNGAFVDGIDISEGSIEISRQRAEHYGIAEKTNFQVMDAENLNFEDSSFDVINCYSCLYALELPTAFSELARVLKPDGYVIVNAVFGHNPIGNWNRKKNVLKGTRSQWQLENIFKQKDIRLARTYFSEFKAKYFGLAVLLLYPFDNIPIIQKIPGFYVILWCLEKLDKVLLSIPFIKLMAFRVVLILSHPKKT